jgi:hypothetical protein
MAEKNAPSQHLTRILSIYTRILVYLSYDMKNQTPSLYSIPVPNTIHCND